MIVDNHNANVTGVPAPSCGETEGPMPADGRGLGWQAAVKLSLLACGV